MSTTIQWSQILFRSTLSILSGFILLVLLAAQADASFSPLEIEKSLRQADAAARIKDYQTIHLTLQPLAVDGNAEAQYRLAGLYGSGRGVSRDLVVAFSLFQEAAQSGLAKAQYQLGIIYEKGLGVDPEKNLARQWFEKASQQGHALAKKKLQKPSSPPDEIQEKSDADHLYLAGPADEVLRWAARRGLLGKVNQLLESGVSPDGADQFGRTALIEAAAHGHADVMISLLKAGADVNLRDKYQVNALLAAVERKNHNRETVAIEDCLICVELLLKYGADINAKDRYGNTPFIIAAKNDKKEIITLLADSGADIMIANSLGHNAAFYSKNNANKDLEQMFSSKGLAPSPDDSHKRSEQEILLQLMATRKGSSASPLHPEWSPTMVLAWRDKTSILNSYLKENKSEINNKDDSGYTALSLAAELGYLQTAKVLLDHNADSSITLNNGMTPLHLASKNGHVQVVEFLINSGAEINSRSINGDTPLLLALGNKHDSLGEVLLKKGANGNQTALNGTSPLIIAAEHGIMNTLSLLLEQKVDINHAAQNGTTALIMACQKGHETMVEQLLTARANIDQADYLGNTGLSYASAGNNMQIVQELIATGANLNRANKNGNTPILLAAGKGNTRVTELLIKAGAEIDHKNNIGNTALMLAVAGNHTDSVILLLQNNASLRLKNKKDERVASLAADNEEIANIIKSHTKGLDWVANFF